MNNEEQITKLFAELLDLYTSGEQGEFDLAYKKLKEMGLEFVLETEESEEWDESEIEGFSEFPTVTQECQLLLGNVVVGKWERQFGIEYIDVTHTGGGGRWRPFRLDDNEGSDIENMLAEIEVDIFDPNVPEPRT
jgi:hypothetical protein